MGEFEEGYLLEVCQYLLQLLLVVQQRVVEGDSWRHAVHLHTQTGQVFIGNVLSSCRHL